MAGRGRGGLPVTAGKDGLSLRSGEADEVRKIFDNNRLTVEERFSSSYQLFYRLQSRIEESEPSLKQKYAEYVDKTVQSDVPALMLYKVSFLLELTGDYRYLEKIYRVASAVEIPVETRVFLYWQIIRRGFMNREATARSVMDLRKLHKSILDAYRKDQGGEYEWIPAAKRNQDLVVVMTNQFLGPRHGPTQTALDRCLALRTGLNKQVVLINTAEMARTLPVPYYEPFRANFVDGYSEWNSVMHNETVIPFYQCKAVMPNPGEMVNILQFIARNKPGFILSIGGNNFTADLCGKLVPVATQGCVDGIPVSEGTFFLPWHAPSQDQLTALDQWGIERERIIESDFTFSIQPQKGRLERAGFAIPRESFVLAVVGGRLDQEVSGGFAGDLDDFLAHNPGVFVAFAGLFNNYDKLRSKYRSFGEQTIFVGFQEDILAFYDLCDAYLNPPRQGGGTSAVEAMSKGLPVFTFPFGDVAHDAGPRYHIKRLAEIGEFIGKWSGSGEFRETERAVAMARAAELTDTGKALARVIGLMENSPYFQ